MPSRWRRDVNIAPDSALSPIGRAGRSTSANATTLHNLFLVFRTWLPSLSNHFPVLRSRCCPSVVTSFLRRLAGNRQYQLCRSTAVPQKPVRCRKMATQLESLEMDGGFQSTPRFKARKTCYTEIQTSPLPGSSGEAPGNLKLAMLSAATPIAIDLQNTIDTG